MPIYEYDCTKCGKRFEVLVRSKSDLNPSCPKCGAARPVKALSAFAVASPSLSSHCDECPSVDQARATGVCGSGKCPFS